MIALYGAFLPCCHTFVFYKIFHFFSWYPYLVWSYFIHDSSLPISNIIHSMHLYLKILLLLLYVYHNAILGL